MFFFSQIGNRETETEIKNKYAQRRYLFTFRTEMTKKSRVVGMSKF